MFSMFLISNSFAQISFGSDDYDLVSEWGTFGVVEPGQFSYPQFIAVSDDDGSIYVSDFGNKRIQKFSSNGEYIADWGEWKTGR